MVNTYYLRACLEARKKGYQKAIDMVTGKIEWVLGFEFPAGVSPIPEAPENVIFWQGAIHELQNTIDMIPKEKPVDGKLKENSPDSEKSA